VARIEKELVDYQAQAERPFEHEERLKQLLARQAELNSALDLDKGDQQGADSSPEVKDDLDVSQNPTPAEPSRDQVAKMAEAYMRASKTAIREMPISQRTPPQTGPVTGRAVAKDDAHIAVATAANSFFVVPSTSLGRDVDRAGLRLPGGGDGLVQPVRSELEVIAHAGTRFLCRGAEVRSSQGAEAGDFQQRSGFAVHQ
jgi:hypothetical protein